jgi:hypothetical protein
MKLKYVLASVVCVMMSTSALAASAVSAKIISIEHDVTGDNLLIKLNKNASGASSCVTDDHQWAVFFRSTASEKVQLRADLIQFAFANNKTVDFFGGPGCSSGSSSQVLERMIIRN